MLLLSNNLLLNSISSLEKVPIQPNRMIVIEDTNEMYYDNKNGKRFKIKDIPIYNSKDEVKSEDISFVREDLSFYYKDNDTIIRIEDNILKEKIEDISLKLEEIKKSIDSLSVSFKNINDDISELKNNTEVIVYDIETETLNIF